MKPSRNIQTAILVLAHLGLAHFLIGFYVTLRAWTLWGSIGTCVVFLLPYMVIASSFTASICFGYTRHHRSCMVLLVIGVVMSIVACAYDFKNARFQVNGGGMGAGYTIWWWYYEPFWYGYEPGNV